MLIIVFACDCGVNCYVEFFQMCPIMACWAMREINWLLSSQEALKVMQQLAHFVSYHDNDHLVVKATTAMARHFEATAWQAKWWRRGELPVQCLHEQQWNKRKPLVRIYVLVALACVLCAFTFRVISTCFTIALFSDLIGGCIGRCWFSSNTSVSRRCARLFLLFVFFIVFDVNYQQHS